MGPQGQKFPVSHALRRPSLTVSIDAFFAETMFVRSELIQAQLECLRRKKARLPVSTQVAARYRFT